MNPNIDERKERCKTLNKIGIIDFQSTHILLQNIRDACIERGIKKIGGLEPTLWMNTMNGRVGNEPLTRLMFIIIRDLISTKFITLAEVLCEDTALFIQAMKEENINVYYAKYPPNNQ
jgi:hypothetical protein